jgi:pyrroloquinoline-quinone synthase
MRRRIQSWQRHYPWIDPAALGYFQMRVSRARLDSEQAVAFVVQHATTYELQDRCVQALLKKADILWHLLDCLYAAYVKPAR